MSTDTVTPLKGRALNRQRRRQEYIDTAIRMVLSDGLESVTMQALARRMDAAVGTAYTYFASKSALIAELETIAIRRTQAAFEDVLPRWVAAMGPLSDEDTAAVRVLTLAEFAVRAPIEINDEWELQQLIVTDSGRVVIPADQEVALTAALGFARVIGDLVGDAEKAGVIEATSPGRATNLIAMLNGVSLFGTLPNAGGVNLAETARRGVIDLLVAWGGDRTSLTSLSDRLATVAPNETITVAPLP